MSDDSGRAVAPGGIAAPIPRLQLAAWRDALAAAPTIPGVIEVVQHILRAQIATGVASPFAWQPRDIRSREDIEHWARRIRSRPSGRPGVRCAAALADLMRLALDRMNELGPKRGE